MWFEVTWVTCRTYSWCHIFHIYLISTLEDRLALYYGMQVAPLQAWMQADLIITLSNTDCLYPLLNAGCHLWRHHICGSIIHQSMESSFISLWSYYIAICQEEASFINLIREWKLTICHHSNIFDNCLLCSSLKENSCLSLLTSAWQVIT